METFKSTSFSAVVTFVDGTTSEAIVYPNCREVFIYFFSECVFFAELHDCGVVSVSLV
jgi:hypothetical protein